MLDADDVFLKPVEVVERYRGAVSSTGTLANWRSTGGGPPFVKIGGRVVYKLADLKEWEHQQSRGNRK